MRIFKDASEYPVLRYRGIVMIKYLIQLCKITRKEGLK